MKPRVMTVYGTRPEAIKVATVLQALGSADDLESIPVTTGQHRQMLDQVNSLFALHPAHDLDVFSPGQTLNALASKVLARLDPVLEQEAPDAVIVQGDTTTAMAGAVAAFNRRIPVVHLEAGLRSGTLYSPFPEEANRRLISHLATLHLAPTAQSRNNILREGIDPSAVVVTGNTVIDALQRVVGMGIPFSDHRLAEVETSGRPLILVTVHRRENWGKPLEQVARAVRRIATKYPSHTLVLPLHRNPVVREGVLPLLTGLENVVPLEPLDYADFARLMSLAIIVLTDSGGVQEEAPSLGKPVLVLRENTERPEAVDAGTVRLVGTDEDLIFNAVVRLVESPEQYARMAQAVNPYGDGGGTDRVLAALRHLLGIGTRLPDFDSAP